ncbi:TIGR01777 family oxidoreductase [Actinomyces bowdenii]|uniref:TIGR01777 family protein n=1 Tax=Actinomyces bowdenii TaxID=131109 RepID=A0A3P1V8J2_9ACTO|nr:TIGR01777 family oxidoreductase [Actinomyces bowdenii]RRD28913.1 TIGR01777 family protein [Actinomyces bowdenii]
MRIECRVRLDHPLAEVAAWHSRPGALTRLTPSLLATVEGQDRGGIEAGRRVGARLGPALAGGARPRWLLEHVRAWEGAEGCGFVDAQVSGPWRHWEHTHSMTPVDGGAATELTDVVEVEPPRGLGAGSTVIARQIKRLLAYRARQLRDDLDFHARYAGRPRLTVAIAGASGLIGTQLAAALASGGHRVVPMVRAARAGEGRIAWDPAAGRLDPADLEGVDAVVNLAGRTIGTRMTARARREILSSRVSSAALIARAAAALADSGSGPRTIVQASGIGYYGARRPGEMLTEESSAGGGFLAGVCRAWEAQLQRAADGGVRTCALRTGIVLAESGGALAPQLPLFLVGLGGRITDARAAVSWIALDDMVRAYIHALLTPGLEGAVNAVAPHPATAGELAATLGRVLRRPAVIPVPRLGPMAVLGARGADELIHTDQWVSDARLRGSGFEPAHPDLEGALRHILRRSGGRGRP